MRLTPISVCLASYNGESFIQEQINSILYEFENDDDELIIIDDNSKDKTIGIIQAFNDVRIKLFINDTNLGVNQSFERSLYLAKNDYIFFSDQDDIWTQGRVEKMFDNLSATDNLVVSGNQIVFPENEAFSTRFKPLSGETSKSDFSNFVSLLLGNASYFGCTMAIKRQILDYVLPFPRLMESHDLWIVSMAILLGKNGHIDDVVLRRRIHGTNASIIKRDIVRKLYSRIILVNLLILALFRIYKNIRSIKT